MKLAKSLTKNAQTVTDEQLKNDVIDNHLIGRLDEATPAPVDTVFL